MIEWVLVECLFIFFITLLTIALFYFLRFQCSFLNPSFPFHNCYAIIFKCPYFRYSVFLKWFLDHEYILLWSREMQSEREFIITFMFPLASSPHLSYFSIRLFVVCYHISFTYLLHSWSSFYMLHHYNISVFLLLV